MLYNGNQRDVSNSLIICDGNSITAGGQYAGTPYPTHLKNLPTFSANTCTVLNLGVSGQTTAQMTADALTQIDSQFTIGRCCVVVAMEIGNDIFSNGSAVIAYNNFRNYCLARRAAGFKVVAVNPCDRFQTTQFGDTPTEFRTKLVTARSLVAANWQSFANSYVNAAQIPELSNAENVTFFPDNVHPSSTALQVLATVVARSILQLR